MNEYMFAGWLDLFFNSSLAVPRSVCTGKDSQGKALFPWQQLASQFLRCAALSMETELTVVVHLSESRSDSCGAHPPKPIQQEDNLLQTSV